MNQHLVVKQSSLTDVWLPNQVSWQKPHCDEPVARLTMVLTRPQPHGATARCATGRQAPTFFSLAAATGLLLAFASVVLGTIYLSGVLLENIQNPPHYNQPQAQYSDVGKWQGHR
jgi:hypothetical protein